MARCWHYVKANEQERMPRKVILGVAKHAAEEQDTRGGAIFKVVGLPHFEDWESLTRHCVNRTRTWLFVNKATEFAILSGLWEEIDIGRWGLGIPSEPDADDSEPKTRNDWRGCVAIGDRPFILDVRPAGKTGTLRIVDIRNWQPDFQFKATIPFLQLQELQEWATEWIEFVKEKKLGNFQPTIAAQTLSAWRHGRITHKVLIHNDEKATDLEANAYIGGRCQVFYHGEVSGPIYHLDYNSLYPWVCASKDLPARLVDYQENGSDHINNWHFYGCECIANVRIKSKDNPYPVRRNGTPVYAVGEFNTVLCGPELRIALNRGHVQSIGRSAAYEVQPIFRDYIQDVWSWKDDAERRGDKYGRLRAKLLANTLYGKFAAKKRDWVSAPEIPAGGKWEEFEYYERRTDTRFNCRTLGGVVQRLQARGFCDDSFPAISAFVSSYARAKLNRSLEIAGAGNCYYCDSDSLFVNRKGFINLWKQNEIEKGVMGKLKLEGVYKQCTFLAKKLYLKESTLVAAGLPLARKEISPGVYSFVQTMHKPALGEIPSSRSIVTKSLRWRLPEETTGGRVRESGWIEHPVIKE